MVCLMEDGTLHLVASVDVVYNYALCNRACKKLCNKEQYFEKNTFKA